MSGKPERISDSQAIAETALPRARLAPAGAPGADGVVWSTRVGAVAIGLALVWLGFASLRPMSEPAPASAASSGPPQLTKVPERADGLEARQHALESLHAGNIFAVDRLAWKEPKAPDPGAKDLASSPAPAVPLPLAELPQDVKQALEALDLKSIYVGRDGKAAAMISFGKAPPPGKTRLIRDGDRFKDDAFPQHEWEVRSIDTERDAVVLARNGVSCILPLYRGNQVVYEPPPKLEMIDGVNVMRDSREHVERDLQRAGISPEKRRELLETLDKLTAKEAAEKTQQAPPPIASQPAASPPPRQPQGRTGLGDAVKRARNRTKSPAAEPATKP